MSRPLSVATLLSAALALSSATTLLAQGLEVAPAANDTAAAVRCCRASPGTAGRAPAAAHASPGPATAHALLLPGPHLRLLRRHEGAGPQLRPHRVHEPHVRPARVRAGGRRADGRRLSLPPNPVSEEPAATVHAGAGPVPAVDGHVHAAVGRVHAGAQPARLPGHGGASAEGASAGATLRLHGDGPRRRVARQAGRRGPAARRRADGGGRRRRHLRRGHRGPQGEPISDRQSGPVANPPAAAQYLPRQQQENGASVQSAEKLYSAATDSDQQYATLKILRQTTNFTIPEQDHTPVAFHSSLITKIYSPGQPINYTLTPPAGDHSNAADILNAGNSDIGHKSEGLMAVFLSYLRGAQADTGSHVTPNGTATNVTKTNTFTKTVFQHLAHVQHSNQTLTTSSELPTLFNGTKVTAKFEEKTMNASKIYAQFETHNSTIQEYKDTVHPLKFLPVRDFTPLINKSSNYQMNGASFAIFSPLPIIFPLLHVKVATYSRDPLSRINSTDATPNLPCSQNPLEMGYRIKCLKENGGLFSNTRNKTSEVAHDNFTFQPQHYRVKRSSGINADHILASSTGEFPRDVKSPRASGSEMEQHPLTSKYLPPNHNKPVFAVGYAGWTSGGGEARRRPTLTDLLPLPRDLRLQARQAWGSMLGILWCAAGVFFSGPSFWNVMACLLQAGQAFIG